MTLSALRLLIPPSASVPAPSTSGAAECHKCTTAQSHQPPQPPRPVARASPLPQPRPFPRPFASLSPLSARPAATSRAPRLPLSPLALSSTPQRPPEAPPSARSSPAGGYDPGLPWGLEDWNFWLSSLSHAPVVRFSPSLTFHYRHHQVVEQPRRILASPCCGVSDEQRAKVRVLCAACRADPGLVQQMKRRGERAGRRKEDSRANGRGR